MSFLHHCCEHQWMWKKSPNYLPPPPPCATAKTFTIKKTIKWDNGDVEKCTTVLYCITAVQLCAVQSSGVQFSKVLGKQDIFPLVLNISLCGKFNTIVNFLLLVVMQKLFRQTIIVNNASFDNFISVECSAVMCFLWYDHLYPSFLVNRPGTAGAVLQSPSSLVNSLIH